NGLLAELLQDLAAGRLHGGNLMEFLKIAANGVAQLNIKIFELLLGLRVAVFQGRDIIAQLAKRIYKGGGSKNRRLLSNGLLPVEISIEKIGRRAQQQKAKNIGPPGRSKIKDGFQGAKGIVIFGQHCAEVDRYGIGIKGCRVLIVNEMNRKSGQHGIGGGKGLKPVIDTVFIGGWFKLCA